MRADQQIAVDDPGKPDVRALYHSAGFVPCGPFGGYQPSEDNTFMTLELGTAPIADR